MDSIRIPTIPAQINANFNQTRYLPTYEESNAPYSSRLPSYRSAYIHRFHPYARYATSLTEERYMVDCDHGHDGPLLDLSILVEPIRTIPQTTTEPVTAFADGRFAQKNQEGRVEEQPDERCRMPLVIVNPDMIAAHLDEQENARYPRQPSPFLRMDVTEPHFKDL